MDSLAVIQRLAQGHFLDELAEALAEVSAQVSTSGKPGAVTVALRLTVKNPGDPMVMVDETITKSLPKKAPLGSFYYAVDGSLWRENPRQPQLPFRTIDTKTGEIREVEDLGSVEREAR